MLGSKLSTQASVTGCGRPTESRNSAERSRLTKSNFAPSGDAISRGRDDRATRPGADQELHQRPDWDLIRGPEVHLDPRLVRSTRDRRDRLEILNREIGILSEGNVVGSTIGPSFLRGVGSRRKNGGGPVAAPSQPYGEDSGSSPTTPDLEFLSGCNPGGSVKCSPSDA
ncbi:hypothetical protein U1Q18_007092 [Sarracenia purpurea var. burkii]